MAFDPFHIQDPDGLLGALGFAEEGGDWTAGREISASQDDAAQLDDMSAPHCAGCLTCYTTTSASRTKPRTDRRAEESRVNSETAAQSPTGINFRDAIQPVEDRREGARVVASFAEYLAEDVHGHPDRAIEAMAALAEWCDDDCQLLEQARANVLRDTRKATLSAQGVIAQNNRDALELLELVARAS